MLRGTGISAEPYVAELWATRDQAQAAPMDNYPVMDDCTQFADQLFQDAPIDIFPTPGDSTQYADQLYLQAAASGEGSIQHDIETAEPRSNQEDGGNCSSNGGNDDSNSDSDDSTVMELWEMEILLEDEGMFPVDWASGPDGEVYEPEWVQLEQLTLDALADWRAENCEPCSRPSHSRRGVWIQAACYKGKYLEVSLEFFLFFMGDYFLWTFSQIEMWGA